jgi:hypothetical protein
MPAYLVQPRQNPESSLVRTALCRAVSASCRRVLARPARSETCFREGCPATARHFGRLLTTFAQERRGPACITPGRATRRYTLAFFRIEGLAAKLAEGRHQAAWRRQHRVARLHTPAPTAVEQLALKLARRREQTASRSQLSLRGKRLQRAGQSHHGKNTHQPAYRRGLLRRCKKSIS